MKKATNSTETLVALCKCSYHYFRNWNKDILKAGGIKQVSFKKDGEGTYNGTILVSSKELVKAKNVLDNYKKKNPDVDTDLMFQF